MLRPTLVVLSFLSATVTTAKPPEESLKRWAHPGVLLQPRFSWDSGTDDSILRIERARLKLKGQRRDKALGYRLSVEVANARLELKDAYIDARAYGKHLQIRAGHFKRPYSRQRLTGISAQGMVDRAVTETAFDQDRDMGFMLHNGEKGGFGWALGLFSSFDFGVPDQAMGPALALRAGWAMKDLDGYNETDATGGPLRAGGAASLVAFFGDDKERPRGYRWEADAIAKAYGGLLSVAVFGRTPDTSLSGLSHDALGLFAHGAFRFFDELEVAARYAEVFNAKGANVPELTFGLTSYLYGGHLKPQAGVTWLPETDDVRVLVQLQVE